MLPIISSASRNISRDFPGGPVVKGHGFSSRSGEMPQAAEQLSLCATATEPALWSPRAANTEASEPRACAPQRGVALLSTARESLRAAQRPSITQNK